MVTPPMNTIPMTMHMATATVAMTAAPMMLIMMVPRGMFHDTLLMRVQPPSPSEQHQHQPDDR